MASHQEDIASKLLHSSDARIAEAAKRVFSSTLPGAAAVTGLAPSSACAAPAAVGSGMLDESAIYAAGGDGADVNYAPAALPLHGGAEPSANISGGPFESALENDDLLDGEGGGEKKPSSTERLKRR